MGRLSLVFSVVMLVAAPPATARAGDVAAASDAEKDVARKLVASGDDKFRAGDYEGALNDYRGADTIMGVPTTGIEVGRTFAVLGRLLEAKQAFERVLAYPRAEEEPEAFTKAREKAQAALLELEERIPRVTITAGWPGEVGRAALSVDGILVPEGKPLPLDPGKHKLEVSAPGFMTEVQTFTLVEAARDEIRVLLRAPPPGTKPAPSSEPGPGPAAPRPEPEIPPWTWIGVGVAGAGVLVGAITGGLSLARASDVKALHLGDNTYPESARSAQEESVTLAHVSTVGFCIAGAGAAVALAGVLVYFLEDAPVSAEQGMLSVRF